MAVSKVLMPKLSEAMETGKIIKWLKKEGDRIQAGDILAEVETDKADVEMEAFGAGVLRKILQPAGSTVAVGGLIGVIAEPDEDIAALTSGAGAPAAPAAAAATEMASRPAAVPPQPRREDPAARTPSPAAGPTAPPRLTTVPAAAPAPSVSAARPAAAMRPAAAAQSAASGDGGRLKASPLARKIAAQSGVDLRVIQGSGPGGRIVRRDVEAASAAPVARGIAPAVAPGVEFEDRPLSQMR